MIGQLMIVKSTTYIAKRGGGTIAGIAEINDLADGAVAVFADDGTLIDATASNLTTAHKQLFIAVGGASESRISKRIVRSGARYKATATSAAVNAVVYAGNIGSGTLDVNLPSVLLVGAIASVKLINTATGELPDAEIQRYEYAVKSGNTKADIINGLVAVIQARPDRMANAAAIAPTTATAGISFTGINSSVELKVLPAGILENAPITKSVAAFAGIGLPAQLTALETKLSVYEGNTSRNMLTADLFKVPSFVDSAATYKTYNMGYSYSKQYPTHTQGAVPQYLQLAVVTGASCITQLDLIFAAAF